MKSKDGLTINLNIGWPVLVLLLALALLLGYASLSARADSGSSLNTNEVEVEASANPQAQSVDPLADATEMNCADDQVPTTNNTCISLEAVGNAEAATTRSTSAAQGAGGGDFYLTDASYSTDTALTACAVGYHMASLWEILDVSNLTYDYDHPAAHTKDDSGFGPPSYWYGWIRTGQSSSGSSTTGIGNCLNWSSASSTQNGVSVRLSRTWETAPGDIFTWDATSFSCSFTGPVWCIGD